jgi:heat shock protein HslJ
LRRAAALALLLAACAPTAEETAAPEGGWLLPGTDWRLVELGGAPYPARVTATLNPDGTVTGEAPCNGFRAVYSGRWPDLTFEAVTTTRIACPDLAAETAFFAALEQVSRAAIGDDGLTFTGAGPVLRFERMN